MSPPSASADTSAACRGQSIPIKPQNEVDIQSILPLQADAKTMVILLLFFFSGVTALIYEVIWSDYLTLLFGSTIQAQTVVLAVFMGGLAAGQQTFRPVCRPYPPAAGHLWLH